MANEQIYRGQKAVMTITDSASADVPVGILQDVEVEVTRDTEELRGSGSTKRKDIGATSMEINVSGTVAAWNMETWETLVNYDSENSELDTSSDLPEFTVDVDLTDTSGTTETVQVTEVVFPSVPFSGDRESYIELDLDGTGAQLETNPA